MTFRTSSGVASADGMRLKLTRLNHGASKYDPCCVCVCVCVLAFRLWSASRPVPVPLRMVVLVIVLCSWSRLWLIGRMFLWSCIRVSMFMYAFFSLSVHASTMESRASRLASWTSGTWSIRTLVRTLQFVWHISSFTALLKSRWWRASSRLCRAFTRGAR